MPEEMLMYRLALLLVGLGLSAASASCFFVRPDLSVCPRTGVELPPDELLAVRVDVQEHTHWHFANPMRSEEHTFVPVDIDGGQIPRQWRLTWYRGWSGLLLMTGEWYEKTVMTKLYRRGYKTVVIRSWDKPVPIEWQPARTPEEQQIAIRDFAFASHAVDEPRQIFRTRVKLAPGSASEQHKHVLLFIASEYERVGELFPRESEGRKDCLAQVEEIRKRAAE
jgi:hypothetical protein